MQGPPYFLVQTTSTVLLSILFHSFFRTRDSRTCPVGQQVGQSVTIHDCLAMSPGIVSLTLSFERSFFLTLFLSFMIFSIFIFFFYEKFLFNFFSRFFMILSRINIVVNSCLFEHANTREHCCSSLRVFLSILAHLANFAVLFF